MEHFHCRLDLGLSLLRIPFHHTVEPVSCILVFLIVFPACTFLLHALHSLHSPQFPSTKPKGMLEGTLLEVAFVVSMSYSYNLVKRL